MPLDFVEETTRAAPVELFNKDSKSRPLHLDGEVIPQLLARVGDEREGTLSLEQVQAYLDKNVLVFDATDLKMMFKEADFKNEGHLSARYLSAALSGRYPKRRMTSEWRQLVCMLLELPELVLSSDIVKPKTAKNGVFNAESSWSDNPPLLPNISWNQIKASMTKSPPFQKSQGIDNSNLTLTTYGLKSSMPSLAEDGINDKMQGGKSSFAASKAFSDFSRGVEAQSRLELKTSDANFLLESSREARDADWAWKTSPKSAFKAYNAALPPTKITLSSSALATLRTAVSSNVGAKKPEFLNQFRPLTIDEDDLKRSLGSTVVDVDAGYYQPMSRVEPTRDTSRKFDAGYFELGSYSPNCHAMPSYWFNEHPSLPESARNTKTKYPWGEWGVEAKVKSSGKGSSKGEEKNVQQPQGGLATSPGPQSRVGSRPQTASMGTYLTSGQESHSVGQQEIDA